MRSLWENNDENEMLHDIPRVNNIVSTHHEENKDDNEMLYDIPRVNNIVSHSTHRAVNKTGSSAGDVEQVASTPTVERNSQPIMTRSSEMEVNNSEEANALSEPQSVERAQAGRAGEAIEREKQKEGDGRKRVHTENSDITLMVVVPVCTVGALIGKGGSCLRDLKDYNFSMEISKKNYHGTKDRVCLVKGRLGNVVGMIKIIMERIRKTCGAINVDAFNHTGEYRSDECKMVISIASAGMLVMHVKNLRKSLGCHIQIYQTFAPTSQERIVTVAHENHTTLAEAIQRVLEVVVLDDNDMRQIMDNHFGVQEGTVRQADVSTMFLKVVRTRSGALSDGHNPAAEVIEEQDGSDFIDLHVPESWIGPVLGPQLKTLEAIRFYSGCKVNVFRRGAIANLPEDTRVIRLSGDNTKMHLGKCLVERVINEAYERRKAHN